MMLNQSFQPINFAPMQFQSLQLPNFVGQLSLPNLLAPTAMLGISNLGNLSQQSLPAPTDRNQLPGVLNPASAGVLPGIGNYPAECLVLGVNCPQGGVLSGAIESTSAVFKKIGLLLLALVLLAFGLYLLANSTDTGKQAIGAIKTAAVA